MNGRLTTGSHAASGTTVVLLSSIDTPVTPPSMKLLDSRKPFSPIAAATVPTTMNAAFRSSCSSRFIDSVLGGSPVQGKPRWVSCLTPRRSGLVRRATVRRRLHETHVLRQHAARHLGRWSRPRLAPRGQLRVGQLDRQQTGRGVDLDEIPVAHQAD